MSQEGQKIVLGVKAASSGGGAQHRPCVGEQSASWKNRGDAPRKRPEIYCDRGLGAHQERARETRDHTQF
jgi:hypothetical protein